MISVDPFIFHVFLIFGRQIVAKSSSFPFQFVISLPPNNLILICT